MMRKLLAFVLVLAALYSGYWFIGARSVKAGATDAIAQLQAQGWQVETSGLKVAGFPSRFDTTASDLLVAPPDRTWGYSAPFAQLLALSYAPNKVIAALPPTQTLSVGGQTLTLTSDQLRASAEVAANTSLTFQNFTAEGAELGLTSDQGWGFDVPRLLAAVRPREDAETTYDVYIGAEDVIPNDALRALGLTQPATGVVFDASATLDRPLDRQMLTSTEIRTQTIDLRRAAMTLGEIRLEATGTLQMDARGVPDGRINLKTTEWAQLVALLADLGVIDPGVAPTWVNAGTLMSGGSETLDLPLTFANGFVSLGPLPLGPAPRF